MHMSNVFEAVRVNSESDFMNWLNSAGDINITDKSLNNLLQIAISYNRPQICIELIKRNIDCNNQNIDGETSLHFASEDSDYQLVQMIIKNGGDINLKDNHGNTPLWTAVFNARGDYEVVRLLLESGSNPKSTNNTGSSPLDFAKKIKDNELIELLNQKR